MRKISAQDLLVLSSTIFGLAYGSTSAYADDEAATELATITVTASSYPNVYAYGFSYPTGTTPVPDSVPSYYVPMYISEYATTDGAANCATAYTNVGPGAGKGPKWPTFVNMQVGWSYSGTDDVWVTSSASSQPGFSPPNGAQWGVVGGYTSPIPGTPWGYSVVFYYAQATYAALINTIAHEWAHQWGAIDGPSNPSDPGYASPYNAYYVGDQAKQAYLNDHGAKCGG